MNAFAYTDLNIYRIYELFLWMINDDYLDYRSDKEINYWIKKDPVKLYIERLKRKKKINDKLISKIESKMNFEINEAFDFAKNDKFPKVSSPNKFTYAEK